MPRYSFVLSQSGNITEVIMNTQECANENLAKIRLVHQSAKQALMPVVEELQVLLSQLEGQRYSTLSKNQQLASAINNLLHYTNTRITCPKCQNPALLYCTTAGGNTTGAFIVRHTIKGKDVTHLTSVTFPGQLTLCHTHPDLHCKTRVS